MHNNYFLYLHIVVNFFIFVGLFFYFRNNLKNLQNQISEEKRLSQEALEIQRDEIMQSIEAFNADTKTVLMQSDAQEHLKKITKNYNEEIISANIFDDDKISVINLYYHNTIIAKVNLQNLKIQSIFEYDGYERLDSIYDENEKLLSSRVRKYPLGIINR